MTLAILSCFSATSNNHYLARFPVSWAEISRMVPGSSRFLWHSTSQLKQVSLRGIIPFFPSKQSNGIFKTNISSLEVWLKTALLNVFYLDLTKKGQKDMKEIPLLIAKGLEHLRILIYMKLNKLIRSKTIKKLREKR